MAARLARAGAGERGVVALMGEAGIGKTRLIEGSPAPPSRSVAGCAGLGRTRRSRILPFRCLGGGAAAGRTRPGAGPRRARPVWLGELGRLVPELAQSRPRGGPADTPRLFEALARLVEHVADRRPLLVVMEDLHWADDMTLRFLAFLGRQLGGWPVLVAVTARVEEIERHGLLSSTLGELVDEQQLSALPLAALSRVETAALVRALKPAALAAAALDRLIARAWTMSEGNPFVITEVMRGLPPASEIAEPEALSLPDRVQEVIRRRLQGLSERGRRLVALAAVIGREFPFALLQRAAELDAHEAADGVEELTRRQVLREVGEHFDFTHDRIREAVYRDLLGPRRRLLHGAVASALEDLHRDPRERPVSALAVHAQAAQRWDAAVGYLRAAGAEAAERGAYREAVSLFERALAALANLPRDRPSTELAIDLRFDLRDWLMPLGELSRLHACLREAEALAVELGDERRGALAAGHLAHCLWLRGEPDRALALAHRTAAAAAALGDPALEVLGNFYLGEAYNALGDYARAVQCLTRNVERLQGPRALERFAGPGLVPLQSRLWLALSLVELGDVDEAIENAEEAHRAAAAVRHPYSLAFAKSTLGRLHLATGAAKVAVPILEQALALIEGREIVLIRPGTRSLLGYAYALTGRGDEGLPLLTEAVAQAAALCRSGQAPLVARLAEALLLAGRVGEALARGRGAVRLARAQRERGHEAWALALLGRIHAAPAAANIEEAARHYRGALTLAESMHMRPLVARCRADLFDRLPP